VIVNAQLQKLEISFSITGLDRCVVCNWKRIEVCSGWHSYFVTYGYQSLRRWL